MILLTFLEKGKKPYIAVYGVERWALESIDIDSKGNVSYSDEIVKDNEIRVYKHRRVIVHLILTFKGVKGDSDKSDTRLQPMFGQFFKEDYLYLKEKKSFYHRLRFERFNVSGDIDTESLKEMEKLRMKFLKDKVNGFN